ncbi:hypothetical protein AB0420_27710 [Streptomyces caelestis]|uniref:hypothetical protein n=1 Tax=Streptomyces TaxID=1883 RepID=UPI0006922F0D|nr:hypothetical protein [Streptomyces sp. NRRL F-2305]
MAEDGNRAAGAGDDENEAGEEAAYASSGPAGPYLKDYATLADGVPRVSARSALVRFYRNGGYSVIRASGVEHVDKRALARPRGICEIALGTYVTPLQMELPAAGGTTFFKAEVDIQWTVTDPHLAALEVVTDVAGRLTSPVLERLREVTTTYRVTEAEQANRAITRECAGGRWSDLGSELGLRVRLYVRLRADDRTIEYADEERDVHARAKWTRLRQDEFRRMLQGGELEQLSFMLAADPDEAKDFLEKIRQEGRQDEKDRVARLFAMAARGELATADVEAQVLNLLNQGIGRPVVGPIGMMPVRRPVTRQLEPSADRPFNPDWASDEPPRRPSHRTEPDRRGPGGRSPHPGDDAGDDEPRFRDRRQPRRPELSSGADDAYDGPRPRAARGTYRPEPYDPGDGGPRPRTGRGTYRPEPYGPGDDAGDGGPGFRDRRRSYRPELSSGADDAYGGSGSRTGRGVHRPEPYGPGDDAGDGGPGFRDRRRPYRPELSSGADDAYGGSGSRTGRGTFRPEPYGPGDDAAYDGARHSARRDAHRPEPYYPDEDRDQEPPRRRGRSGGEGWPWTEEDR